MTVLPARITQTKRNWMSELDDLEAELQELLLDMANIRAQIDEAKAKAVQTGEYSDPDWFRRAHHALRMKGIRHQELLRDTARLRKKAKQLARPIESFFVDVAREQLEALDFQEMWEEATRRKEGADNAP